MLTRIPAAHATSASERSGEGKPGEALEGSFTGQEGGGLIGGGSNLIQNILVRVNGLTINLDHVMQMRSG